MIENDLNAFAGSNAFIELTLHELPLIGALNGFDYHVALQTRLNYVLNSKFINESPPESAKRRRESLGIINFELIKLGE